MAIAYQDFNKFIKFIFVCYCIYRNKNHFIQISRLGLRKNYMCRKKLDSILIIDATSGGF